VRELAIERGAVGAERDAVLAHALAVVAGDDDDRLRVLRHSRELVEQPADLLIGPAELGIVEVAVLAAVIDDVGMRDVAAVRIDVVRPQEPLALVVARHERERVIGDLVGDDAVWIRIATDRVVVLVEALLEAPVAPPFVRSDRAGVVPAALHDLLEHQVFRQQQRRPARARLVGECDARVEELRGQDRRDRGHRAHRGRVREREVGRFRCQLGEPRRGVAALLLVAAERRVVVADGVDREEEDVPVLPERLGHGDHRAGRHDQIGERAITAIAVLIDVVARHVGCARVDLRIERRAIDLAEQRPEAIAIEIVRGAHQLDQLLERRRAGERGVLGLRIGAEEHQGRYHHRECTTGDRAGARLRAAIRLREGVMPCTEAKPGREHDRRQAQPHR
jgi:hypothetical protein